MTGPVNPPVPPRPECALIVEGIQIAVQGDAATVMEHIKTFDLNKAYVPFTTSGGTPCFVGRLRIAAITELLP